MYQGRSIVVVMPAFDEERMIETTVGSLPEIVDRIIVVDDASTDNTTQLVEAISDSRVSLIRLSRNLGVGGAIIAGHRQALAEGADVAVVMAGDGQMDPEYLPQLLDPICRDGYDFAKANRLKRGSSSEGMPPVRLIGNYVMSALIKPASGYWRISDPLNGYTAITASALSRLPLDRIRQDYSFETDLLINLNILGSSNRRRADPGGVRRRGLWHQSLFGRGDHARLPGAGPGNEAEGQTRHAAERRRGGSSTTLTWSSRARIRPTSPASATQLGSSIVSPSAVGSIAANIGLRTKANGPAVTSCARSSWSTPIRQLDPIATRA